MNLQALFGARARSGVSLSWVLVLLATMLLAACGGSSSSSGTTSSSTDSGGDVVPGGTLRVATFPATNLDPALGVSGTDYQIVHQLYSWLVQADSENNPVPDLATDWEASSDGKTWTFSLRPTAKFSDGQPLTADDVVYTFQRLKDPKLGSPASELYENVDSIRAVDPHTVEFILKTPNPVFTADLTDPHAGIIRKGTADPVKEEVYSGAFVLESYSAEDRAVLVKNPNYDLKDSQGRQLPYLDGLTFIFSPDPGGQVEALRGGEVEFVGGLTAELAQTVQTDPDITFTSGPSNQLFLIHIRSDEGHVGSNLKLRQALNAGTDYDGLLQIAESGFGTLSNGTIIGPSYADYYLDEPHVTDVAKAKQLLAEAGYPDGLTIPLVVQNIASLPTYANAWKAQMEEIGVNVELQLVPGDVYYGEGPMSWLEVDFGTTDWSSRANPLNYFQLAYVTDGPWNESHWSNPEFDSLVEQISTALDPQERADLYKRAQEILIEEVPVIVPYFFDANFATRANVVVPTLPSEWTSILFRDAYFTDAQSG